jgi:hypothetical protein
MLSTQPDPPPITHSINTYPCTYSHREGGGGGVGEPERRLEGRQFTRGVKNTDLLYLQSINFINTSKDDI